MLSFLLDTCPADRCHIWCGGNDLEIEGRFQWLNSKTIMNFTNWEPGQPSLENPEKGEDRDCVGLTHDGLWENMRCTISKRFICEKP